MVLCTTNHQNLCFLIIYPKNINLGFNDFEILQWTENKEEAVYWNEYECAEWFAINYENANVVEIERGEKQ